MGGFSAERRSASFPPTSNPIFTLAGSLLVVRVNGGFTAVRLAGDTDESAGDAPATHDDDLDDPARDRGVAGDVPNARPFADDIPVTAPPRSLISRGDVALSNGDFRTPGDDPYAAYMTPQE